MRIRFLGGAETVTGSRFLVEAGDTRLLVDCGLFQGYKNLRLLNWKKFPVPPASLDAVLLTHAHVDHSGYLPALVRDGFRGPIHATPATRDLCDILLPDAARLSEEEARLANLLGTSRHDPAKPLFTTKDADAALRRFDPLPSGEEHAVGDFRVRFVLNGHILGSSCVLLDDGEERVLFSGDVGRPEDVVMPAPEDPPAADRLVLEATYGGRLHDRTDPALELRRAVAEVARTRGVLLVPAFAVGRAQALLVLLHRLLAKGKVPAMPIVLDSPMAKEASHLLFRLARLTRLTAAEGRAVERRVEWVGNPTESLELHDRRGPFVLVSASGMLTGGRVLDHFAAYAPQRRNVVLLTGYQAGGTRGARLLAGERDLKVRGKPVHVRAHVAQVESLSAHADAEELLAWVRRMPQPPRATYLVHGEPPSADALRRSLQERLGWACEVPRAGDRR